MPRISTTKTIAFKVPLAPLLEGEHLFGTMCSPISLPIPNWSPSTGMPTTMRRIPFNELGQRRFLWERATLLLLALVEELISLFCTTYAIPIGRPTTVSPICSGLDLCSKIGWGTFSCDVYFLNRPEGILFLFSRITSKKTASFFPSLFWLQNPHPWRNIPG